MALEAGSRKRHRWHIAAWMTAGLAMLATAGAVLMFVFWPFRYRSVHPLLEKEFRCRVKVTRYYRTYIPHPGFVADGVTFWRNEHPNEPPLATVDHLHVVGTWTGLLFTPHTLYQIWLRGVHVRIVLKGANPPGAQPSGQADASPTDAVATGSGAGNAEAGSPPAKGKMPQPDKLNIETIVANGAVLDLLREGKAPLRFIFETLQIHNLRAGEPLTFFARAVIPALDARVDANGKLGPLQPGHFAAMPMEGTYAMKGAELNRVSGLAGHAAASGSYSGTASDVRIEGKLAIPDFRAGGGHTERVDAEYQATVEATRGRVTWQRTEVRLGGSSIEASGSVAGDPKQVQVEFATKNGNLERLLEVVEGSTPSVRGKVSFTAHAEFGFGPQPFLKRLGLKGTVALEDVTFVDSGTQKEVDAFSARARKARNGDPVKVDASATGETAFREGVAYFRDVQVKLPGARARLHGTFNLLNTRVNLTGTAAMHQSLSRDVTGWKRWLLAPLDAFFRHGRVAAVVPIAVTGTAKNPKIGQNLLHNK